MTTRGKQTEEISITRQDANFDRACDGAIDLAQALFMSRHRLKEWDRHKHGVEIQFIRYVTCGTQHTYLFTARFHAIGNDDE